jgi:uncharacterized protein with PIN domain
LRAEDDASDMAHAIERARDRRISAANYLEAAVIDGSRDPVASRASTNSSTQPEREGPSDGDRRAP